MMEPSLLKIGKTDVRSALGFFLRGHRFTVVAGHADLERLLGEGHEAAELRRMGEIEAAFLGASAFGYIQWSHGGMIVREGARRISFLYDTHRSTICIR